MDELEERDVAKENDQYCQYNNLPILLKRFSFEEKMGIATIYSSHAILFSRKLRKASNRTGVLPWCLETFVMLAMEAKEYTDGNFKGKNENKFIKMYNAIWDASAVVSRMPCGRFDFFDIFMAVTALNQFHVQESPWIRQYRYWCIFNDNSGPIHMETVFKQKMGTDYEDFLLLGYIFQVLLIAQADNKNVVIPQKALYYLLCVRFPKAANHLKITRTEYIELQRKFIAESDDPYKYVYSLCPSYQYAFVEDSGSIYFPLPHLLNQCMTSSLLYRLTEGDNILRNQMGKHVWEKYLLKLVTDSGAYQEVFPEQKYKFSGSNSYSPDVLARQGNQVLFIDSKSTVPNLGIRLFDPDSYEDNIRIVAENIVKLYNQMHRFDRYNPFSGNVSSNRDDYWGIVIVLEDAYIRRVRYFEAAAKKLKIQEDSVGWKWMISHIKVISLYEIERLCLGGDSIIDGCRESFGEDHFNFTFMGYPPNGSDFTNKEYRAFRDMYDKKVLDIISDMNKKGVFR